MGCKSKNIIENGSFSKGRNQPDSWELMLASEEESSVELSTDQGMAHVSGMEIPMGDSWEIQLIQRGINLEQQGIYKLSFQARSNEERTMDLWVSSDAELNWKDYATHTGQGILVHLTQELQSYSYGFSMSQEDDPKALISFFLGDQQGDLWIDDLVLEKIGQGSITQRPPMEEETKETAISPSELIRNGHFDGNLQGWVLQGDVKLIAHEGEVFVVIKPGDSQAAMVQPNLKLEAQQDYLFSFTGRGKRSNGISCSVELKGDNGSLDLQGYVFNTAEDYYSLFFNSQDYSQISDLIIHFDNPTDQDVVVSLDKFSLRATYPYMNPDLSVEQRVDNLMSLMNNSEKAAQMVQSERAHMTQGRMQEWGVGSVLSGGGSVPQSNTPEGWIETYNDFQNGAMATGLSIPYIYGIDAVHGHTNVQGSTGFPQNIGLGATRNPDLIEQIGRVTAEEVRSTGLNWTFGPCVAVGRDIRWGRFYESYGENPELQSILAGAYVRGLQGPAGTRNQMEQGLLAGCAKHFIGDGGVEYGTGEGDNPIDRGDITYLTLNQLKEIHGAGYRDAIDDGVYTVMASYSMFQGRHMHAYKELLTGYLKAPIEQGGLGFDGFVVGDWDAMANLSEIPGEYPEKVIRSFNAGVDMSMEQSRWEEVIHILVGAVEEGRISQGRIDDAVSRILTVKFKMGLFDNPYALKDHMDWLGSEEHRDVARQAVKESLVLLKNDGALPLQQGSNVYVGGPLADNVGGQNGGWTMDWQGGLDLGSSRYIQGSSILEGIQIQAAAHGGTVYTDIEEARGKADVAVIVVGEKPYAEMFGDIPQNGTLTLDDVENGLAVEGNLEAIEAAKQLGIPVVVILISGRPMVVTQEIDNWNAFVAAWLPGTQGAAIADVLYGDDNFTGRLPVSWPRSVEQLPLTVLDRGYNTGQRKPLFEYGFGLSY
jgi:beta-glucosidase